MKTRCKRAGWVAIFFILIPAAIALAQEEYSGAFYFGESGAGDGVLGPVGVAA